MNEIKWPLNNFFKPVVPKRKGLPHEEGNQVVAQNKSPKEQSSY